MCDGGPTVGSPRVEMILEGLVLPVAWKSSGEATVLGLTTFDERDYVFAHEVALERDLAAYVRRRVRLVGVLRGREIVDVKRLETA